MDKPPAYDGTYVNTSMQYPAPTAPGNQSYQLQPVNSSYSQQPNSRPPSQSTYPQPSPATQGYAPPPPVHNYPQPHANQMYGPPTYPPPAGPVYQQAPAQQQPVIMMQGGGQGPAPQGSCPMCQRGVMLEEFTCCGIFLAIVFFPFGLICLFCMKQRRCAACGFSRPLC